MCLENCFEPELQTWVWKQTESQHSHGTRSSSGNIYKTATKTSPFQQPPVRERRSVTQTHGAQTLHAKRGDGAYAAQRERSDQGASAARFRYSYPSTPRTLSRALPFTSPRAPVLSEDEPLVFTNAGALELIRDKRVTLCAQLIITCEESRN